MRDDVAGPDGSALSEELGLPQPAMLRGVDEDYYTAEQIRAYGAQERAAERERQKPLLRECEMVLQALLDVHEYPPGNATVGRLQAALSGPND